MKTAEGVRMLPFFLLVFVCSCHDDQCYSISFRENEDVIDSLLLYAETYADYNTFLITRTMYNLSEFDNTSGFIIGPMYDDLKKYSKHSFFFNVSEKRFYIYNDIWGYFVKQNDYGCSVSKKERGNWSDYYKNAWYIHIDVDHSIIIYRNTKNMLPAKVDTNVKFKSRNTSITDKYE